MGFKFTSHEKKLDAGWPLGNVGFLRFETLHDDGTPASDEEVRMAYQTLIGAEGLSVKGSLPLDERIEPLFKQLGLPMFARITDCGTTHIAIADSDHPLHTYLVARADFHTIYKLD